MNIKLTGYVLMGMFLISPRAFAGTSEFASAIGCQKGYEKVSKAVKACFDGTKKNADQVLDSATAKHAVHNTVGPDGKVELHIQSKRNNISGSYIIRANKVFFQKGNSSSLGQELGTSDVKSPIAQALGAELSQLKKRVTFLQESQSASRCLFGGGQPKLEPHTSYGLENCDKVAGLQEVLKKDKDDNTDLEVITSSLHRMMAVGSPELQNNSHVHKGSVAPLKEPQDVVEPDAKEPE